jgi:hypothetical protein
MESSPIYTIIITLCKTSKIQFKHITDKAENNQRIKGNEENVRECVWMLDGIWLVHLNHYSVFGIKRNV